MLEMLIQSHNDVISLLPAPTLRWKEGSATGLRARGNIEADIRWKDGKVTHWKLRSPQKRKVKVLVNGECCVQRGKKLRPGDTVTFGSETVEIIGE